MVNQVVLEIAKVKHMSSFAASEAVETCHFVGNLLSACLVDPSELIGKVFLATIANEASDKHALFFVIA